LKRSVEAESASCERRGDRYALVDAWLEWRVDHGAPRTFQVLDASRQGLCFGLEPEGAPPEVGAEMGSVVLRLSRMEIRGRLIVTQTTTSLSRGDACGGEFFPASPEDEARYREVIAALELGSRLKSQP